MATLTLTEFLLARIAEDEAAALAAKGDSPTPWANDGGTLKDAANTTLAGYCGEETSAHIVRHDPDRVLAECEAKRRIAQRFQQEWDDLPDRMEPGDDWKIQAFEETLQILASVYAKHPDFNPAWRA